MDHGVVELSVGHRRLGDRMCSVCPVGVEHEVELAPPGRGRRGAGGVDDPAVGPDEVDDVGLGDVGSRLAGLLGSGEHVLDLLAHLVVDLLGLGVAGEAAGEEVVETSVSGLHREQVLQVGDERLPRVADLQGLVGAAEELVEPRFEGGHEEVQPCREVAIEGADGDACLARDLLQGGIHTVGGELVLRSGDELVAALPGIAAQRPAQLIDVALAHSLSLRGFPETRGPPPEYTEAPLRLCPARTTGGVPHLGAPGVPLEKRSSYEEARWQGRPDHRRDERHGPGRSKLFVDEGAHVVITGRRKNALDEAVDSIGHNVTGVQADSANLDDLDRLFETVSRKRASSTCCGPVPGRARRPRWARSPRTLRRCLLTERPRHPVHGPIGPAADQRWRLDLHDRVERLAPGLPRLERVRSQQGRAYRLRTVWVSELKDSEIRVNVLTPGSIVTPKMEQVLDAELKEQFKSVIPRRKMGRPEEIASIALFLASDDSSYVNGMELVADGGTTVI